MSSKNNKQKKVFYKGNVFIGTLRGGKVAVRAQKTAKGQNILAGTYAVSEKTWENSKNNVPLPKFVKQEIELAFCET